MSRPPLIVRLLLDGVGELFRAADAIPEDARDVAKDGMNTAGWIVAHAGFIHDVWMNADGRGIVPSEGCDPWLLDWSRRQREASRDEPVRRQTPIETPFAEARAAAERAADKADAFIRSLSDEALTVVPDYEEGAFPEPTTVGYLVARDVAHLFAHAAELNVIATAAGAVDIGLPGRLSHTSHG